MKNSHGHSSAVMLCCTGQQGLKRLGQLPKLPVYLAVNSSPNCGIYSHGGSAGSLTSGDWEKKRGNMKYFKVNRESPILKMGNFRYRERKHYFQNLKVGCIVEACYSYTRV